MDIDGSSAGRYRIDVMPFLVMRTLAVSIVTSQIGLDVSNLSHEGSQDRSASLFIVSSRREHDGLWIGSLVRTARDVWMMRSRDRADAAHVVDAYNYASRSRLRSS